MINKFMRTMVLLLTLTTLTLGTLAWLTNIQISDLPSCKATYHWYETCRIGG